MSVQPPAADTDALELLELDFPVMCDYGRIIADEENEPCPNQAEWTADVHECSLGMLSVLLCTGCKDHWVSTRGQAETWLSQGGTIRCLYCRTTHQSGKDIIDNVRKL